MLRLWNDDSNCEYAINWIYDGWWNTCVLSCELWTVQSHNCRRRWMKGEGEKNTKFCALNELRNLNFNIQMIKFEKNAHTWPLFIVLVSHKIGGKFKFQFKFHLNLKLNLWSQSFTNYDLWILVMVQPTNPGSIPRFSTKCA